LLKSLGNAQEMHASPTGWKPLERVFRSRPFRRTLLLRKTGAMQ
jgi:hypothetical protein